LQVRSGMTNQRFEANVSKIPLCVVGYACEGPSRPVKLLAAEFPHVFKG
jgi:hypothetical protein